MEKNLLTDGEHATKDSRQPSATNPRLLEPEAGLVQDNTSRDAEIAKASLLNSHSRLDLSEPVQGAKSVPGATAPARVRQAIVEPRKAYAPSQFDLSAWLLQARSNPLLELVHGARKTMNTSAWSAALAEQKWIKVSTRIEELKSQNKWSLRQIVKQKCAPRRKAHWDFVLDEMTWMRTDFREERKWKIALARRIAHAVLEWHHSEDRSLLTIPARPIAFLPVTEDIQMKDTPDIYEPPTPPSGSDDTVTDRITPVIQGTVASHHTMSHSEPIMVHSPPLSAVDDSMHVFDLPSDQIYAYQSDAAGRKSPSLLPDMPIYGPPVPDEEVYRNVLDSMPMVNVSKYTQLDLRLPASKKRSRSTFEDDFVPIEVDFEHPTPFQHTRRKSLQVPFTVRPPFVPHNIERRAADRKDHQTVWTNEADDLLLNLLAEYQYNWDFVAQAMTPPNPICAVADRKSPWDCFERWVQIDPRSNEVVFTGAHARLVQSRVDDMIRTPRSIERSTAKRTSSNSKVLQLDLKKQRQFSLFDAMRKVQRKRENQPKAAPPKKVQEMTNKLPANVPTPQHLSQMKYERDQQAEKAFIDSKNLEIQNLHRQRLMQQQQQQKGGQPPTQSQMAQMQAARQTQVRAQMAQQAAQAASGMNPQLNGRPLSAVPARPSLAGQMPPRPATNGMANGTPNGHISMNTQIPNAGLLRNPSGLRVSQEQMNLLIQQSRLQKSMTASPSPGPQTIVHTSSNGTAVAKASPALVKIDLPQGTTGPVATSGSVATTISHTSVANKVAPVVSAGSQTPALNTTPKALPTEKA